MSPADPRYRGAGRSPVPAQRVRRCCRALVAVLAMLSTQAHCGDVADYQPSELRSILRLSPLPPPPADPSNAVADDASAAEFGRQLFFDRRLSARGDTSCATCHDPARGWTDGKIAHDLSSRFLRNVPSLRNNAYNRWFYWDGRADSAWAQALGPIEHPREMASDRLAVLRLIADDPLLRRSYDRVFGPLPTVVDNIRRFPPHAMPMHDAPEHPLQQAWLAMAEPDRHTSNIVFSNVGKAIAAFERGILHRDSAFDRYVHALRSADPLANSLLPEQARRGLKLFVGRAACTLCHSGPNFSDGEFHDVGIALGHGMRIDPGRHRGVLDLLSSPFTRIGVYSDDPDGNPPIRFLDLQGDQLGQFKTPSLRGVADTAPYMHDGRFADLRAVVQFYSTRQGARVLGHPTTLLQPLNLSDDEVNDLIAFLRSL